MTDTVAFQTTESRTLPESWEWAAYSELGEWSGGGTPSKSNASYWEEGTVPWFSPKDMRKLELHDPQDHITEDALHGSAAKPIRAGSLLFVVRSGILRRTLPVALTTVDGAVNQDIKALTPSGSLSAKYLLYATLAQKEEIRHTCKKAGTTVESIQVLALQTYSVPIPPLNEQRRIVEKIEELFTKLDAGIRSLEQARTQLKSYRQSVLKAAVEGELSREWREAHRDELEPASELLDRILQERREKFAGKKYKEPAAPDTSELPALPEGWEWTTLTMLCTNIGDVDHKMPKGQEEGVPYVSTRDFLPNTGIDLTGTKLITKDDYVKLCRKIVPARNDILLSRYGTVGEVRLVDTDQSFQASYSIAIIKPASHSISKFLALSLQGEHVQAQVKKHTRATAQPDLGLGHIREFTLAFPPLEEQRFIIEEVERRLSVVDKLEATVEANLRQAAGLRQSILKQAFSGELVPQDPDDEPASMLLARIREECKKSASPKKRRKKPARAEGKEAQVGLF